GLLPAADRLSPGDHKKAGDGSRLQRRARRAIYARTRATIAEQSAAVPAAAIAVRCSIRANINRGEGTTPRGSAAVPSRSTAAASAAITNGFDTRPATAAGVKSVASL